jgi:hypothetical protein
MDVDDHGSGGRAPTGVARVLRELGRGQGESSPRRGARGWRSTWITAKGAKRPWPRVEAHGECRAADRQGAAFMPY